jgi:hypothetical protein
MRGPASNEAREPTPAPQHVDGDRARCRQGAGVLHRQPRMASPRRRCRSPAVGRTRPAVAAQDGGTPTRPRLRTRGARDARAHGAPARHRHGAEAETTTARPAPLLLVARVRGYPDCQSFMARCIPTPLGLSERSFSVSIPRPSRACPEPPPCPLGFRAVGFRKQWASMTAIFSPRERVVEARGSSSSSSLPATTGTQR